MKLSLRLFLLLPFILFIIMLNFNYFNLLKIPSIIPSNNIITILLIISYLLKYISIFKFYKEYDVKTTKDYNKYLLVNIIFNFISVFSLTIINNLFLTFSSITICFLSNLFLYYETKSYDIKTSKFLLFDLFFSLICSISTLIIYFMNL